MRLFGCKHPREQFCMSCVRLEAELHRSRMLLLAERGARERLERRLGALGSESLPIENPDDAGSDAT